MTETEKPSSRVLQNSLKSNMKIFDVDCMMSVQEEKVQRPFKFSFSKKGVQMNFAIWAARSCRKALTARGKKTSAEESEQQRTGAKPTDGTSLVEKEEHSSSPRYSKRNCAIIRKALDMTRAGLQTLARPYGLSKVSAMFAPCWIKIV